MSDLLDLAAKCVHTLTHDFLRDTPPLSCRGLHITPFLEIASQASKANIILTTYLPKWISSFVSAAAATGRVVGIAIGGSYARGTADQHSDVDMFFLLEPHELMALYRREPSYIIELIPGHVACSYPSIIPEFGLRYCIISSQVGLCDFFFDDESGFPTPLRGNTQVLWELDGRFTRTNDLLYAACEDQRVNHSHFIQLAAQLIMEYDEAVKCITRNRPVQAWYRVSKVLNLLLGTQRGPQSQRWWYNTSQADEVLQRYQLDVSQQLFTANNISALADICRDLGHECQRLVRLADELNEHQRQGLIGALDSSLRLLGSQS